jgi:hypothetical protein
MPQIAKTPVLPTKEEVKDVAVTSQAQQEQKRKGFKSTVATGGMGVTDTANIRKTKMGE